MVKTVFFIEQIQFNEFTFKKAEVFLADTLKKL